MASCPFPLQAPSLCIERIRSAPPIPSCDVMLSILSSSRSPSARTRLWKSPQTGLRVHHHEQHGGKIRKMSGRSSWCLLARQLLARSRASAASVACGAGLGDADAQRVDCTSTATRCSDPPPGALRHAFQRLFAAHPDAHLRPPPQSSVSALCHCHPPESSQIRRPARLPRRWSSCRARRQCDLNLVLAASHFTRTSSHGYEPK